MQQSTSRFLRARVPVYRRKNASSWQGDRLTSTNASPVSALARFVLREKSGTHPESRHTLALMCSDIAVPSRPLVCRRLIARRRNGCTRLCGARPAIGTELQLQRSRFCCPGCSKLRRHRSVRGASCRQLRSASGPSAAIPPGRRWVLDFCEQGYGLQMSAKLIEKPRFLWLRSRYVFWMRWTC